MKLDSAIILPYLTLISSLLLVSCGGGSGSSTSTPLPSAVKITGTVSTGYTVAAIESKTFFARLFSTLENRAYAGTGVNVNTVTALRIEDGALNSASVANSVSTTINTDGTFSLSLDKKYDWILLLMDKNATGTDQFIGTVALNNGTDSLLNLPTSATSSGTSTIALGAISDTGSKVGLSANTVNTADFSLSAAQLLTLAKTDDVFKNAKNLVLNYNTTTGVYYRLRPDFHWFGSYSGLTTGADPAAYVYDHYTFQLDSNSTDVSSVNDLCVTPPTPPAAAPVTSIKLFTPTGTTAHSKGTGVIYNDTTIPITNDAAKCTLVTNNGASAIEASEYASPNGDFFATNAYGSISYSFGGYIDGTIPAGYWQYWVNSNLRGQFDISAVAPIATNNGIKGFVPAIKVNTDGTGKITSVDITWYVVAADGVTKTLLAPADLPLLKHAINNGSINFDVTVGGVRTYESVNFDPKSTTHITPAGTWYFDAPTTTGAAPNQLAKGIGIFYESAGVGYFFDFFNLP